MADREPQINAGKARCEGIGWDELMAQDSRPAPNFLTQESYQYRGSDPIPVDRYTSED